MPLGDTTKFHTLHYHTYMSNISPRSKSSPPSSSSPPPKSVVVCTGDKTAATHLRDGTDGAKAMAPDNRSEVAMTTFMLFSLFY